MCIMINTYGIQIPGTILCQNRDSIILVKSKKHGATYFVIYVMVCAISSFELWSFQTIKITFPT